MKDGTVKKQVMSITVRPFPLTMLDNVRLKPGVHRIFGTPPEIAAISPASDKQSRPATDITNTNKTVKKSVIVAFLKLLKSIETGEEVFLLRSSDMYANKAIQTYNDSIHSVENEDVDFVRYVKFISSLSERFNRITEPAPPEVVTRDKELFQKLAAMLLQLKERIL